MPGLTLYDIADGIADLMDARAELLAQDPAANPDRLAELAQVEGALKEYVGERLPARVDGAARWIRSAEAMAAAKRQESKALYAQASALEDAAKRLKALYVDVMAAQGWKSIEGAAHKLMRRGNGGVEPLALQETVLPLEMFDVIVRIPQALMDRLAGLPGVSIMEKAPSNARIREALKEPCEHCAGTGWLTSAEERRQNAMTNGKEFICPGICPGCGGNGKRNVPGAHLQPRGEHLEVK